MTPRAFSLQRHEGRRRYRAPPVDWLAEGIDNAAEELFTHRHRCHAPRPFYRVPFPHLAALAEENAADVVLFEIEDHAEHPVRKLHQLAHHGL
jgi:hypothetical protein